MSDEVFVQWNGKFETWFQPVLDTSGHRIVGQECFTRLASDPNRSCSEILGTALARNQLAEFDAGAATLAIRAAGKQRREGRGNGPWFVNFIPVAITDADSFIKGAVDALIEANLAPADIIFEAVESDLSGDSARLRQMHDLLRNRGFGFSLDNAGKDQNSFQMICSLRPDFVKIDQRLSWNAEQPVCAATIRKLVELSDLNGVRPVATGVERARTVENLWLLGVQLMQGYLFGRPSPASGLHSTQSNLANLAKLSNYDPAPVLANLNQ